MTSLSKPATQAFSQFINSENACLDLPREDIPAGWFGAAAVQFRIPRKFFSRMNKGRSRVFGIFHVHGRGEISTCMVEGRAIAERFRGDAPGGRTGSGGHAGRDAAFRRYTEHLTAFLK